MFNLIKDSLGSSVAPFIQNEMVIIDEKTVCILKCEKCPNPVYLKFKNKEANTVNLAKFFFEGFKNIDGKET